MYAVVFEKKLMYLGKNFKKTIEIFSKKNGSSIHKIDNIDSLYEIIGDKSDEEDMSDAVQKLVEKLDGLDQTTQTIPAEKISAEVRSMGVRNINTIDYEFMVLTDNSKQQFKSEEDCREDIRKYLQQNDL